MGLFDFLKKKKKLDGKTAEEISNTSEEEEHVCALCGQEIAPGEGKYYGGQWWHKKCLRKARKMAKTMI